MNDQYDPIQPARSNIPSFRLMYRDVVECLTEPRLFFTDRYPRISFNYALALGILVSWFGAFLDWLTRVIRHETLLDGLLRMRDQLQQLPIWKNLPADIWAQNPEKISMFPAWLAELFGIVLSPFNSLVHFLVSGILLWIGASILIPKTEDRDRVTLANTIKLVALTSIPKLFASILGFLPLGLGTLIGAVYAFVIMVLAISIRYQVSKLRSVATIALPGLLGIFIFGCMIAVLFALIFGTLAAFFQVH